MSRPTCCPFCFSLHSGKLGLVWAIIPCVSHPAASWLFVNGYFTRSDWVGFQRNKRLPFPFPYFHEYRHRCIQCFYNFFSTPRSTPAAVTTSLNHRTTHLFTGLRCKVLAFSLMAILHSKTCKLDTNQWHGMVFKSNWSSASHVSFSSSSRVLFISASWFIASIEHRALTHMAIFRRGVAYFWNVRGHPRTALTVVYSAATSAKGSFLHY